MGTWTVLFRIGKRRRKRYVEYKLMARDAEDARDFGFRLVDNKRAVLVSVREAE